MNVCTVRILLVHAEPIGMHHFTADVTWHLFFVLRMGPDHVRLQTSGAQVFAVTDFTGIHVGVVVGYKVFVSVRQMAALQQNNKIHMDLQIMKDI